MGLYEGIKDVLSIVNKVDNIDLYKKLLDLQAESLEMSSTLQEKEKNITALEKKLEELQEALKIKSEIVRHANLYFNKDDDGEPVGYAYCPRCYEVDHVLVHIAQNPLIKSASVCPQCKSTYNWWRKLKSKEDS